MNFETKYSHWFYWATVVGLAIFYLYSIEAGHNWGGDFSQYIHHAKNIVEGKAYNDILYVSNGMAMVGPSFYPPVLPILLAIVYAIFGINLVMMKAMINAFFVGVLCALYSLFKERLSGIFLLALLVILGLNPYLLTYKDNILSEFPFLFFSMLSLYLMCRYEAQKSWTIALLLGLTMYLAYGTREVGMLLVLTLVTYEVWHYKKITKGAILAVAIFLLLVFIQSQATQFESIYPEYAENLNRIRDDSSTVKSNFHLLKFNPELLRFRFNSYSWGLFRFLELENISFGRAFFWLLNGFAIAGFVTALIKKIQFTEIYLSGYLCALFLYGGFDPLRYLIPIYPFYVFYILKGISLLKKYAVQIDKAVLLGMVLLLCYSYLIAPVRSQYDIVAGGIQSESAQGLFHFIEKNSEEEEVSVFVKPRVLALFAQRPTSSYPLYRSNRADEYPNTLDDIGFFYRYLAAIHAKYLIVIPGIQHQLEVHLSERPEMFVLNFQNSHFKVYEKIK